MLASIPVNAGRAGSPGRLPAMVVGIDRGSGGVILTVRVPADSGLQDAPALQLEPLIPEIPGLGPLSGGVLQARPPEKGRLWRDLDLLVPSLPPPLDTLLVPGGSWESPLAPDQIPRA